MAKTRLILASVLVLAAAACGQLNQSKQAPPAGDQATTPAAEGSTDGKPAEAAPAGGDANKPAATAPADKPS